ncbi:Dolichyl pyrophosphate Glc1Man9GlcNAc2 alpha-1,3-glucosyltransferase, putative [Perkinsus marinus ATCC 50983]|uniref:dolichyl-P-Glc:Glc1Man9GlcNAc2-PP-dolichol alpha-1,3-glucosyltransferase n=1 Tax=Perkinsus marinus (strain ATCC 50983 / TXsc) TaxID=423536 RepID=C5LR05_PERM5|nr:Dolichyl pyrophosphate Glc1Man9GlcNAc2 alpha-1,3-glucosyltransferase, putative [Perkinsus marinus ATCC 50983]EER00890.1 Dolichyl pyrophosphate Glc1Man9GlcNAc2 alpha-1,3-glucosyltransferase, putative [Perkinsus marinus ATCC 50983]|eukprot:XP_002768172.1 Dolichyl pyrophosphate Glc1Man9GlcNAc2 alpha-1,3-glucosyltransferase, putative [Perkinsus marinus ATCC 50983]
MSSEAPRRYLPGNENSSIVANRYSMQPPLKRRRTVVGGVTKSRSVGVIHGTSMLRCREDSASSTGASYSSSKVFGQGLPHAVGYLTGNVCDFVTPDRRPEAGLSSPGSLPREPSYEEVDDALEDFKNYDWKSELKSWDRKVVGDAQYCAEIAQSMYHRLFEFDAEYVSPEVDFLDPNYLEKRQYRITPRMRAMLVDWLVDVLSKWEIRDEALHLCISLVDRFLYKSERLIEVGKLQLVGICCAMIASKMQNSFSPELDSLMRICDGAYDILQIEQMEHAIIKALDYRIDLPTAWTYLRRWNQIFSLRRPYYFISAYFLDLTLLEYETLKFRPAVVALACAWVAVHMKRDRKKRKAMKALVHRNWLAVTFSLPVSKWYVDGPWAPSQWTLDYPPVFAYFEKFLAKVAAAVAYLTNSDRAGAQAQDDVAPGSVVLFQRLTVIVSDLTLIPGVLLLCPPSGVFTPMKTLRYLGLLYMLAMPALLLIDHVHFQYNGMLLGVYFSAIGLMQRGNVLCGAVAFTLLVLSKHIFAYAAPAIGVWLLCNYCMVTKSYQTGVERNFNFRRLLELVVVVLATTAVVLLPIMYAMCGSMPWLIVFLSYNGELQPMLSRMFPFDRGLTHAYWAPNVWALYYGADVVLAKLKGLPGSAFTHGLVQVMDPTVLPPIRPIHALLATGSIYRQKKSIVVVLVAVYLPILTGIVRESGRPHGSQRSLLFWATIGSSASFMCGWHVHEKALVTVVAPMMLEIILKRDLHGSSRYVTAVASLSTFMMASLLPLLPDSPPELGLKCTLTLLSWSIDCCIGSMSADGGRFHRYVVAITAMACVMHQWILPAVLPSMTFAPLMFISVFCSIGVTISLLACYWFSTDHLLSFDDDGKRN